MPEQTEKRHSSSPRSETFESGAGAKRKKTVRIVATAGTLHEFLGVKKVVN